MLTSMLTYRGLSVRPTEGNDMVEDGVATRTERRDSAISAWREPNTSGDPRFRGAFRLDTNERLPIHIIRRHSKQTTAPISTRYKLTVLNRELKCYNRVLPLTNRAFCVPNRVAGRKSLSH
jgi:hypothetical protein